MDVGRTTQRRAVMSLPDDFVGTVGLRDWLIDQQISVYMSSASVFRNFAKTLEDGATFPLVHAVRLASEAATSEDFKLFKKYFSPSMYVRSYSLVIRNFHRRSLAQLSARRRSRGASSGWRGRAWNPDFNVE